MAQRRHRSERRLAALSTAFILFVSCGQSTDTSAGWFAPERVSRIEVSGATRAVLVTLAFPPGYEQASGFVTRATLSGDTGVTSSEQTDPELPIRVPIPETLEPGARATLSLTLGFCSSEAKDICYVDIPEIDLVISSDDAGATNETVDVRYTPEPPQ